MEADGLVGSFMVTFGFNQYSKEDLVVMFSAANSIRSTKMKNTHRRYMTILLVILFFKQKTWNEKDTEAVLF